MPSVDSRRGRFRTHLHWHFEKCPTNVIVYSVIGKSVLTKKMLTGRSGWGGEANWFIRSNKTTKRILLLELGGGVWNNAAGVGFFWKPVVMFTKVCSFHLPFIRWWLTGLWCVSTEYVSSFYFSVSVFFFLLVFFFKSCSFVVKRWCFSFLFLCESGLARRILRVWTLARIGSQQPEKKRKKKSLLPKMCLG